jgi:hypothetical protein
MKRVAAAGVARMALFSLIAFEIYTGTPQTEPI